MDTYRKDLVYIAPSYINSPQIGYKISYSPRAIHEAGEVGCVTSFQNFIAGKLFFVMLVFLLFLYFLYTFVPHTGGPAAQNDV